jgi:hypothetical protein
LNAPIGLTGKRLKRVATDGPDRTGEGEGPGLGG